VTQVYSSDDESISFFRKAEYDCLNLLYKTHDKLDSSKPDEIAYVGEQVVEVDVRLMLSNVRDAMKSTILSSRIGFVTKVDLEVPAILKMDGRRVT